MRDLTNQCFGRLTAMEPIQKDSGIWDLVFPEG